MKNALNYLPANDIEINVTEDGNVDMFGEEELITRAVLNVLMNGIKYSHSDKIDISVEGDDKIRVKIKDYGVGIAPEHLERIFEKFYRVDKARSRKSGDSGLGLAIVKNIVELHNGVVYAESEPNNGTCFVIEFPC